MRPRSIMIVTVAVAGLVAVNCSSGTPASAPTTPPVAFTSAPPTTPSPPVTGGGILTPPPGPSVKVIESNYKFAPVHVVIAQNQGLSIPNKGTFTHNFSVTGTQVALDTAAGQFTNTEPIGQALTVGDHPFFCKYHKALGMIGVITVVA